jgi:hypothetical protein
VSRANTKAQRLNLSQSRAALSTKNSMKSSLIRNRHKFEEGTERSSQQQRVIDARKSIAQNSDKNMIRSVVSNRDSQGNLRISQVRMRQMGKLVIDD